MFFCCFFLLFVFCFLFVCFVFVFNLFTFRGHSEWESASGRVTYLLCGLHRIHVLVTATHEKSGQDLGKKKASEWTGRVEISKEEVPGSKRSMYGYILTYSRLKGRTFKLCVLTRWDFNFCVRSSPLRGIIAGLGRLS